MTTNRSISWIDRKRWDSLLAAATQRSSSAASAAAAAIMAPAPLRDTRPVTRAAVAAAPAVATAPAAAPAPAPAVVAPAKVTYPPFHSDSSQLDERLQALVSWIESCVACRAAFIADDNGLPVVEHLGAEQGHIAAASSILLMLASVRSLMRDSGGWLSLKMSSAVLHVVEVATRWGRFGIGVVTDDSLPLEFLTALSAAVESAFHGESSQGE